MRLYRNVASANCYKITLALAQLGKPCEVLDVGLVPFAERPAEFLKLNPGGRVPLLVTDDGFVLPESGAILCLIADGTDLFPSDAHARAEVLQWMFFELSQRRNHTMYEGPRDCRSGSIPPFASQGSSLGEDLRGWAWICRLENPIRSGAREARGDIP